MTNTGIVGFSARLPLTLSIALLTAVVATPARTLNPLTQQAKNSVPALGYTGIYALASIISTIAGTLILYV